ncbi:lamina-associated polypeptide 2, isoforms beta/delta/epsilon/gamma-like isoform X2 [Sinocyclocheilus rhinocerous]|uniref:lamina-associated polypeptide 2, isoforms beta/delta/epsilon/gamma-like isoform X1 n=2 Tax=Sinocyclocheilus rhinocerous TaxID=307959 RepID=UPI0007B9E711|nr:PREDICTED: lamina-associated polypeptide 2, isoforms beta/delta/epsilon/gamma-like isoform X1 [Sinocyclocheilus rhinocerous]XP_016404713.1 PREDICTED: lamina-associated polypeptide 2, isoforms beta/delta/epsilon/gamma-like isoform X2 [Sinocyclocheilus rhinocerous]
MPVFVEDPALFSKERLESELIAHNVDLPPPESKKHAYVELYLKHERTNSTDFSSDEEEGHLTGSAEKEEAAKMVDLGLLTDDQLKAKLLQYGVKAGPIVASTRALYEKKLKRLLDSSAQASQHRVNGIRDAGLYSDNEEEDSESEQLRSETMARTETSKTASKTGTFSQSRDFYPRCFVPSAGFINGKIQHKSSNATQNGSLSQSGSPYRSFSITQMVEQIETRFSPQSKQTEIERRSGQRSEQMVDSRALRDFMRLDKDTMTGRSLCLTSPSFHQKQTVTKPVTDVLSEMFPDTAKTPTGIYATKRRPIKGAAGRPVQFKYPEMPLLSPTTLERQEIQQRLVPLWVQIVVFLLVVCLLYLIYASMEEPLSNPFTALLEGLQEAALIYTSEDQSTTDATA